jgi:nucleoside-triphosphatase THEP1
MVYIVAGGIDEGKTEKMDALYQERKQGDGFLSKKIFVDKDFVGYEIVRLSSGENMPLAYKSDHVPGDWDEMHRFGPFSFSKRAFAFARQIIDEIIDKGIEPVFIDEIGPLELRGEGFCEILQEVLNTGKDVYISVRSRCVEDVIEKFNIQRRVIMAVHHDIAALPGDE